MATRPELLAEFQIDYPWMPQELASVWVDAYVEHGDSNRAWQEVRNGSGKAIYDQFFPGNRRADGTLRLSEPQYRSTMAQYRNTLAQRGLDPAVFNDRLTNLLENEVSAQEFESRVAAVNESIAQRSEEIRRAFAEASGVQEFTPEAMLATVLDPDGIGRELLERRISVAQVRGTAAEFGFRRDQDRVEELIARADISEQRARQFFSQAQSQLDRFQTASRAARGEQGPGIRELEQGALLGEQEQIDNLTRLLGRERAMFSSRRGLVRQNRETGAMVGLGARGE